MEVSDEQRRLSTAARLLLCLGVACCLGLVGASIRLANRRHRVQSTRALLLELRDAAVEHVRRNPSLDEYVREIRRDGQPGREYTQRRTFPYFARRTSDGTVEFLMTPERDVLRDSWGHRIQLRHPGTLHQNGWDLYSFGPNEVDELGAATTF